jgi:hypothetical protein
VDAGPALGHCVVIGIEWHLRRARPAEHEDVGDDVGAQSVEATGVAALTGRPRDGVDTFHGRDDLVGVIGDVERPEPVGLDEGESAAATSPSLSAALDCLAVGRQAGTAETLTEETRRRWSAVLLSKHRVDDVEAGIVGQGAGLRVDGAGPVQADRAGLEPRPQLSCRRRSCRGEPKTGVDVVAAQPGRCRDLHGGELCRVEPARRQRAPEVGEAGLLARLDVALQPRESLEADGVEDGLAVLDGLEDAQVGVGSAFEVGRWLRAEVIGGRLEQLCNEPRQPLGEHMLSHTGAHDALGHGQVSLTHGDARRVANAVEVDEIVDVEHRISHVGWQEVGAVVGVDRILQRVARPHSATSCRRDPLTQ